MDQEKAYNRVLRGKLYEEAKNGREVCEGGAGQV